MFGGRSVEHEISIISALQAAKYLDQTRYQSIAVYFAEDGKVYSDPKLLNKSFYTAATFQEELKKLLAIRLFANPSPKKWFSREAVENAIKADIYFPIFHGTYGEDGRVQALLELENVPFVGSGTTALSLAMNKHLCKQLAKTIDIEVLPSLLIKKATAKSDFGGIISAIKNNQYLGQAPYFIKPNNLGSSIGASRAFNDSEIGANMTNIFRHDHEAIVEPCILDLMEINCAVLDDKQPIASVVEIPVASAGVLSYEDKYIRGGKGKKGGEGLKNQGANVGQNEGMAGLTRIIDPSDLDQSIKERVRQWSINLFGLLGLSGVARFDYIFDLTANKLYFNEVNPIPGSLSFYLWEKSNPSLLFPELLDKLIEGGFRNYEINSGLQRKIEWRALKK